MHYVAVGDDITVRRENEARTTSAWRRSALPPHALDIYLDDGRARYLACPYHRVRIGVQKFFVRQVYVGHEPSRFGRIFTCQNFKIVHFICNSIVVPAKALLTGQFAFASLAKR